MFENILNQPEIVNLLKDDIKSKKLPASLLFYGDNYNAKLTTALELARILSCEKDGKWGCSCVSCEKHRLLENPSTIMLGSRYFIEEIEAFADVLRRNRQQTNQYQFVRAVRKLTRRFDQQIWEGQEKKLKGLDLNLEKIEIILDSVYPGKNLPEEKKLEKILLDAVNICKKIVDFLNIDNIPIDQIRNITYWAHTTFTGSAKVIIIEGADRMGEASRNALLKIIEEPPPFVYFLLISTRKSKIIPTILSRVRTYNFKSRTEAEETYILNRIFKEESKEYKNLRDYFISMNGVNISILRQHANKIIEILINRKDIVLEDFSEILEIINENHIFRLLLEEIIFILHGKIISFEDTNKISVTVMQKWNVLIHKSLSNRLLYNMNTRLIFETLLYQMREAF